MCNIFNIARIYYWSQPTIHLKSITERKRRNTLIEEVRTWHQIDVIRVGLYRSCVYCLPPQRASCSMPVSSHAFIQREPEMQTWRLLKAQEPAHATQVNMKHEEMTSSSNTNGLIKVYFRIIFASPDRVIVLFTFASSAVIINTAKRWRFFLTRTFVKRWNECGVIHCVAWLLSILLE